MDEKTIELKDTEGKINLARQDIQLKEWRISRLKVKKYAIEAKELFISNPMHREHPKASEIVDCLDAVISNSTVI